jgi:NADPH:quinone reductase-like Zn-dependent oxidoreductase
VRVRVAFSGINFADILARMGQYPDAPKIPCVVGYEVAGTVDEVGPGVSDIAVGDRVVAFTRFNGYSDVVVVPAQQVMRMSARLGFDQAAAIPVNYITAWLMLVRLGNVQPGEKVLVHAAAGGVGQAALQICLWKGAEVIGTASASKHARLKERGVAHCIDYTREAVPEAVRRVTGGHGADIILDSLGGRSFKESYKLLAPMGRLCMFGASSMAPSKTRSVITMLAGLARMPFFYPLGLLDKSRAVMGVNLGHLWEEMSKLRADFDQILDLVEQGVFVPVVDKVFAFAEAPASHHYIQDRKNFGKVLLKP